MRLDPRLAPGLAGFWAFVGGTCRDLSAHQRHPTVNGGADLGSLTVIGKSGMRCDGSNDYVATTYAGLSARANASIAFWYRRPTAGASIYLGNSTPSGSNNGFWVAVDTDGRVYGEVATASSYAYGSVAQNDTQWHHLAVVYDGSESTNALKMRLYLDGMLQTLAFVGTIPTALPTVSNGFEFGRIDSVAADYYSTGEIADVAVYERPLSQAEAAMMADPSFRPY